MTVRKTQASTLADVARAARVSLMTASRVLNGSANVRQEKIAKVQAAMARLDYRPNELARSLMTRKSSAIGIIVANLSNPFVVDVIKEVQEIARSNGYVVTVTSSGGDAGMECAEIATLVRRQIDGLIIAPAESRRETFRETLPIGLPLVTFDNQIHGANFDSVTITNRASASEATRHMLSHGYRRIVAIGTRPNLYTSKKRTAGYREAMIESKLQPRAHLVDHESQVTAGWLKEILHQHAADALISLNWTSTLHVLRGLRDLGLKAGQDYPLICFDDFDLGDVLSPRLSVVRQPSEMLGRETARLLFDRLKGHEAQPARRVVLPASLVIRESCGCH